MHLPERVLQRRAAGHVRRRLPVAQPAAVVDAVVHTVGAAAAPLELVEPVVGWASDVEDGIYLPLTVVAGRVGPAIQQAHVRAVVFVALLGEEARLRPPAALARER